MNKLLLITLLLAGCATQPEVVHDIKTVDHLVKVPCLTQDQLPPDLKITTNDELKKLSDGELVLIQAAERKLLLAWYIEGRALLLGCVANSPPAK